MVTSIAHSNLLLNPYEVIRIYHEDGLEQSVPRITVWHHEACQGPIQGFIVYKRLLQKGVAVSGYIDRIRRHYSCISILS